MIHNSIPLQTPGGKVKSTAALNAQNEVEVQSRRGQESTDRNNSALLHFTLNYKGKGVSAYASR